MAEFSIENSIQPEHLLIDAMSFDLPIGQQTSIGMPLFIYRSSFDRGSCTRDKMMADYDQKAWICICQNGPWYQGSSGLA